MKNIKFKMELDASSEKLSIEYWERETMVVTEDGDTDHCICGWTVEVYRHNIRFTGEFNPNSPVQYLTSELLSLDEVERLYFNDDAAKWGVIINGKKSSWSQLEDMFQ